jgi:hypothetical protein
MENKQHQKTSRWAVVAFIFTILIIIGTLFSGFEFKNWLSFGLETIFDLVILILIFFLPNWVRKRNLRGVMLAKISFYILLVIFIIGIIASFVLAGYTKSLDDFSTSQTQSFFQDDFAALKEVSTDNFKRLISYESEISDLKEELEMVGDIKECVHGKYDYSLVGFGPNFRYDKLDIGLLGSYSLRCYGEKKSFDIVVFAENQDGGWLVDSYKINTNLGKDLIKVQE